MAEKIRCLCKAEVNHRRGPSKTFCAIAFATRGMAGLVRKLAVAGVWRPRCTCKGLKASLRKLDDTFAAGHISKIFPQSAHKAKIKYITYHGNLICHNNQRGKFPL